MEIKCYDKYNSHYLILDIDDEIDLESFSSRCSSGRVIDDEPDLTNFKIIK